MTTQKVATQYRLSRWAKTIQARQESGQNIKDFCQAMGISKSQYFYWQRKLRNFACTELSMQDGIVGTPNGWIQVAPVKPMQMKKSLKIEINGIHIDVDAETDAELLKKVCRVLRLL